MTVSIGLAKYLYSYKEILWWKNLRRHISIRSEAVCLSKLGANTGFLRCMIREINVWLYYIPSLHKKKRSQQCSGCLAMYNLALLFLFPHRRKEKKQQEIYCHYSVSNTFWFQGLCCLKMFFPFLFNFLESVIIFIEVLLISGQTVLRI